MIHPRNTQQIETIAGLRECDLPNGFEIEYEMWLRMYHTAHSGGGPLPVEMLIPLLRTFSIGRPDSASAASQAAVRWDRIPKGQRVLVTIGGYGKSATFVQAISGGTLGVQLEGETRVMEVPAVEVRLDNSIPKEINLPSMKDDLQAPSAKEQKHLKEDELPDKWNVEKYRLSHIDWSEESAGTSVVVDGKEGVFVGLTPNKKNIITVEVDGDLIELDARSPAVQLPSVSK
jgi:hypothetical protein